MFAQHPQEAPDISEALLKAELLRDSGQWQQAADTVQAILSVAPNHADAWAMLAIVLPQIRRLDDAEQAAKKALALAPLHSTALRALAVIYLRQQKIDEAITLAEAANNITPQCPRALMVLASARMAKGRVAEAEEILHQALSFAPLAEIHANLAILEGGRNNFDAAIYHAELAVKKKPFLISVWQALANFYLNARQTDSAINALISALQQDSSNAVIMSDLGELYRQSGQYKDALHFQECAVNIAPNLCRGWVNYGTILQNINRVQEAISAYERAISINPDQIEVLNNLSSMYSQEGQFAAAVSLSRRVLSFRPKSFEAHANLAALLQSVGEPDAIRESVLHYQKAFSLRTGLNSCEDPTLSAGITDVFIELTNKCNFHCDFCPSDILKRKQGFIDLQLAKNLYLEVSKKDLVPKISLHLMGEPTLYPEFFDLLTFGASLNTKTVVVTNGSTLNNKTSGKLFDVLHGTLVISLQTPSRDTFKHRGQVGLSWERYIHNIRSAVREYVKRLQSGKKINCNIELRVMITKDSYLSADIIEDKNDIAPILKEWYEYVANIEIEIGMVAFNRMAVAQTGQEGAASEILSRTYPLQQGVSLTFWQGFSFANAMLSDDYILQHANESKFCPRPFRDFGVLCNGDVTLCCLDYDGELSVGNINESTIEELLNSEPAQKLRAAMLGRSPLPSFCRQCQATAVSRTI